MSCTDAMITPAQIRAARALLDWSQERLAVESGLSKNTVIGLERGRTTPLLPTAQALVATFERHGVEMTGLRGVAFKEAPK